MKLSRKQYRELLEPLETIRVNSSQHYPVDPHKGELERTDVDGLSFVNVGWEAFTERRKLWRPNQTFYYYGIALGGLDGLNRGFHLNTPLLDKRDLSLRTSDSQANPISFRDEDGQLEFLPMGMDEALASMSFAEKVGLNEITPELLETLGHSLLAFVELQEIEISRTKGSS